MKLLEGTKNGLERIITPLTNYLGNSKVVNAITSGMMMTIPVTIGVTLFAILGNLPFEGWKEFLMQIGVYTHMQDMISATLSLLAVYMVVIIAYSYAKEEGMNGMTAAVIALGSFLCLMPMSIKVGEEQIPAILNQYLGSDGIFVAMFVGVFTAKLYCALKRKNIGVKLPESVPPMVADAINPVFISIIIFTLIFFIRIIFGYTPYENIFNFVSQVIALPVKVIGSSVWSVIAIFTFMNICWFFGLHPAPIINISYVYPKTCKPNDIIAAQNCNAIRNWLYLDMAVYGRYNNIAWNFMKSKNIEPVILEGDMEILSSSKPDYIAFNYYSSITVSEYDENFVIDEAADQQIEVGEEGFFMGDDNEHLELTDFGWEIDPIGFRVTLREVNDRYNLPIIVTENGIGAYDKVDEDGSVQDHYRIDYLKKHIEQMELAIAGGVDVIGYCPWAAIDLISTHQGFRKRYGFIYINRDEDDLKDLKRIKKQSFYWYKEVISSNGKER
ncbi:family 1 glycosylhydrolase [Bacillus mycoides]|uniref:family 1 glycosylhydrolase n=1 Tax=Bacillus mycoides TaxID=1405 RepID=UPI003D65FDBF